VTYIRFPIETNPEQLAQDVYDYIQVNAPGWTPNDGNLDVWIIRAMAAKAAESRDLASDVQDSIFRYFGANLMSIPPNDATPASVPTTWTMIDTAGYTIPANTAVGIRNAAGDTQVFLTVADIIVPFGVNATPAGDVLVQAMIAGSEANGLGGAGQPVDLIDQLAFVSSITMTGATTGGADAEDDDTYLSRLSRRLRRLSQRPILPEDFAELALDASTEVARAIAIDEYDPGTDTYGHDRTVTIAAVKADGTPVSGTAKTAIQTYLDANREVNFVVHTMDATYTRIQVHADVVVLDGYDPATVVASVVTAIQNYLLPSNWGQDPTLSTVDALTTWVDSPTVYYNELIALVSNVAGVDRVDDLTSNIFGNAATRVDLALSTPAGLPTWQAGDITATAV